MISSSALKNKLSSFPWDFPPMQLHGWSRFTGLFPPRQFNCVLEVHCLPCVRHIMSILSTPLAKWMLCMIYKLKNIRHLHIHPTIHCMCTTILQWRLSCRLSSSYLIFWHLAAGALAAGRRHQSAKLRPSPSLFSVLFDHTRQTTHQAAGNKWTSHVLEGQRPQL